MLKTFAESCREIEPSILKIFKHKTVIGNYNFKFKLKTIIGNYDFKLKFKIIFINYDFNHFLKKLKIIITNYNFMTWMERTSLGISLRMKLLCEFFFLFKEIIFTQNSM